jgi:hypothetical protein
MAGPSLAPLAPGVAASVTITVTDSSVATALVGSGKQVMLFNGGSAHVFINFGASTQTAAVATGCVIPVGAILTLTRRQADTHIACISGTTGQTLYVITGEGE